MILMAFHHSFHYFSQKFPEREKLFSVFANKKLEAQLKHLAEGYTGTKQKSQDVNICALAPASFGTQPFLPL